MSRQIFKVATGDEVGNNWPIANFGQDEDNKGWWVTTDYVHASELYHYSGGSKFDAELVARLLNEHYAKQENIL